MTVESAVEKPEVTKDMIKAALPPVLVMLMEVHKGDLVHELNVKQRELVAAVKEIGKGGELTMKLRVNPHETGAVRAVDINWNVEVKKPKAKQRPSVAFVKDNNDLTRRDPAQPSFPGMDDD